MDEIPIKDEYENTLEIYMDLKRKIIKLGELNKLVYEDLILSINTKVAFGLVKKAKSADFLDMTEKFFGTGS